MLILQLAAAVKGIRVRYESPQSPDPNSRLGSNALAEGIRIRKSAQHQCRQKR